MQTVPDPAIEGLRPYLKEFGTVLAAWLLKTGTYGGVGGARLRRKARESPRVSGVVIWSWAIWARFVLFGYWVTGLLRFRV
ncbi:hypothetical protein ES288_A06G063300v1 [Gossypium darwinii]|uniref:Uncharacterized protein n=2 Tax=Gossypium TaxID=3633 RepID=A0A5D2Q0S1_GOSTO|nr:hypothetical protein ES288_A06G063300v1 [Gossypium darwinii]TYI21782.1 hypothetical protein ES332_A06G062200v1 [Gossypium tomentosum]TYI21783.1 hypothetical protein ES332_A06G062200v1 [Gossypium tomentosum]